MTSARTLFRLLLLSPPACRHPQQLGAAVRGKTVLITGASHGTGEATARLLASWSCGAEVLLLARSMGRLEEVASACSYSPTCGRGCKPPCRTV